MIDDQVFIDAWAKRPYKLPENGFVDNSAINTAFMRSDLAKSGLTECHPGSRGPKLLSLSRQNAEAGYVIPYCYPNGEVIVDNSGMLFHNRTRLKLPEFSKEGRYLQPSGEQLERAGLPKYTPYIHPLTIELPGEVMICAEGEKKTNSILKYVGLPAFGIGGCQMWRHPSGSGDVHPWIREVLDGRGIKKVIIVPDGDLLRYDICNAYGTFAHTLRNCGYSVQILNPPGKIDDLIVQWGADAESRFHSLPRIDPDDLVQSPAYLSKRYNLAYRQTKDGAPILHQNSSNVTILLENHQAFEKIWRNTDDNRVYIGDSQAIPDQTEMEIANYFQHNLGMEKVGHKLVYSCIQALAKKNQRSPMLEWVKTLQWDGVKRLGTWLNRLWGAEQNEYIAEVGTKWLVGACARMENPGTKIDWMMIIIGPQGVGKTSMPSLVFRDNSLTLYGESNDKDLHMKLHSALVIGFDELDSFGKKESSFLKAMITTSQDHFRPPYGSSVEVFDRRCTLYGCGNRYEFLQADQSGYRRYGIVEVDQKLDFVGLKKELDQLWAEAWHVYSQGTCEFWEVQGASDIAKKYTIPSPLEDKILDFLQARNRTLKDGNVVFTLSELFITIGENVHNPNVSRDIAAYLRNIGAKQISVRVNGSVRKMWSVKKAGD